jgi:uncharacterized protein YaaN involved in tellurite resistance
MKTINPPKWAPTEKIESMKTSAKNLVVATKEKAGPALTRIIGGIGDESNKKLVSANDAMSGGVDTLLKGLDGKSPAGEKLLELRSAMDELNPHSLHNSWWFSWMPAGIKRKAISRFINKYEPMKNHLNSIFDGLRHGKDQLLELSIELEQQYDEVMTAKKEIESDIYIAEIFIQELEAFEAESDKSDALEQQKISSTKNQVMRRIRDLRTKEQAAVQFFISIDQTIQSNTLLDEQFDSALTVGPMVMSNALRIQSGLATQKSVKESVEGFQNALGDMMVQNAEAVNQATQEIGDLYNNPVIALDKMEQGFDQLMSAVSMANKTMEESTVKARESANRLAEMTAALEPVAAGMRDARESKPNLKIDPANIKVIGESKGTSDD